METKNDTEKDPVGKDEVEAGTQGNPADGSSADSRRDCTASTHVGSIPPPNNENNVDVQISATDMPDSDATLNNTASSLDKADQSSLIDDSSNKEAIIETQDTVAEVPKISKTCPAVDEQPPPADPGNDRAMLEPLVKPLNEEISPPTDEASKLLSQSPPVVEPTKPSPTFPGNVVDTVAETSAPASSSEVGASNSSTMLQKIDESACPKPEVKDQNQTVDSQQTNPVPPAPLDETTIIEDAVRVLRAPLVDAYAPFIEPSDTSLAAARERLKTAIEQTRQLRAAFSDRVYEKYRVCLRPPPSTTDILNGIYADPVGVSTKLQEETRKLNEEKEVEKKEAIELNAQWAASHVNAPSPAVTADNAEQFMYIATGLSLVILPEQDVDDIDMSKFHDRAPIDHETGQRVRSISVAAAAAGELIIDRARKGAAVMQDRRQRRNFQRLPGSDSEVQNRSTIAQHPMFSGVSNEQVVIPPPSTVPTKPTIKTATKIIPVAAPQAAAAAPTATTTTQPKSNRSRAPPAMSANNLLSISPMSEELRPSAKISAATAALIAKGVGCPSSSSKSPQLRKHPHPDSMGGRRQSQSLKNYAAYVSISLPQVPTAKERRDAKVLSVLDSKVAGSPRAVSAIQQVVSQFVCDGSSSLQNSKVEVKNQENTNMEETDQSSCEGQRRLQRKRRLTEIGLLQGIQRIGEQRLQPSGNAADNDALKGQAPKNPEDQTQAEKPIDPILAFCVLQAVGLVRKPGKSGNFDLASRLYPSQLFKSKTANNIEGNFPFVQKLGVKSRNISSRKRSFSDAFLSSPALDGKTSDEQSINEGGHGISEADHTPASPRSRAGLKGGEAVEFENAEAFATSPSAKSVESCPVESLRGGGDVLLNSPGDGSAKDELHNALNDKPSNDRQGSASELGQEVRNSDPSIMVADGSSHSNRSAQLDAITMQLPSASSPMTSFANQTVVWEDHAPQAISLLNSRIPLSEEIYASVAANAAMIPQQRSGGYLGPQPGGEHYHHRPAASALQLAQQLRHATVSIAGLTPQGHQSGASDLSEYIGSLHSPQARAYDWSSLGAAAMAASMGLTPHHSVLTVPDQARLLLSREQQTAVAQAQAAAAHRHAVAVRGATSVASIPPHLLFNGVPSHAFPAPPNSRFAHLGAQSAASAAAFLTSSSSSRILGRTEIPLSTSLLRSDPPSEQQPSQKAPIRSRRGSSRPEGSEFAEEKSIEEFSSKESKKPTQNSEIHVARKRKTVDPSDEITSVVDPQIEQVDTGKRRKVVGSDVHSENQPIEQVDTGKRRKDSSSDMNSDHHPIEQVDTGKQRKTGSDINSDDHPIEKVATGKPDESNGVVVPSETKVPVDVSNMDESGVEAPNDSPLPQVAFPKPEIVLPPSDEDDVSSIRNKQAQQSISQAAPIESNAMRFVVPPIPQSLPQSLAELVRSGRFHQAIESAVGSNEDSLVPLRIALIEYLVAVGGNVPIPKALVSNPLKDRMSTPVLKNAGSNGNHPILREVIVATILVWLWTQHEDTFQRAFAMNGRIDVDPCCKWLIQAAIDASTRALTIEIADAAARGGPMAVALAGQVKASPVDNELVTAASARLDVLIASTISKSLMTELEIDETMDFATQAFEGLVEYLEDCRLCALRCKSHERALLAAVVSRRTTMSESFSHAYVSAMVRAGLALGQGDLFESVQNDATMTSTMIPYDIIEDENGLWEDPCRPLENVSQLLTGDDLVKRAHARAMIQKSLKKLQDRHHLKGGVARPGPYADPVSADGSTTQGGASKPGSGIGSASQYQKGWSKRRTSSFSEPPVPPGTGSAEATSKSLYDPRHYSAPLIWIVDDVENIPYGRHNPGLRPPSIAPAQNFFRGPDSKRPPKEKSLQATSIGPPESDGPRRSTCEIDWADVAGIFQQVTLPGSSPAKRDADEAPKAPDRDPKSIIAPFCHKVEGSPDPDDDESSEDEDLSDDEILKRHQVVLDRMKQRLNTFFETRKKAQQRRKTNKTRA